MRVRRLEPRDLECLPSEDFRAFGKTVEAALVVVDAGDKPIVACSAQRSIELHMVCGEASPGAKLAAIRLLHQDMSDLLRSRGYNEASAWCDSPRFGRRLERWFGWAKALPAWTVRF